MPSKRSRVREPRFSELPLKLKVLAVWYALKAIGYAVWATWQMRHLDGDELMAEYHRRNAEIHVWCAMEKAKLRAKTDESRPVR